MRLQAARAHDRAQGVDAPEVFHGAAEDTPALAVDRKHVFPPRLYLPRL
jgi:hypothetical protein